MWKADLGHKFRLCCPRWTDEPCFTVDFLIYIYLSTAPKNLCNMQISFTKIPKLPIWKKKQKNN